MLGWMLMILIPYHVEYLHLRRMCRRTPCHTNQSATCSMAVVNMKARTVNSRQSAQAPLGWHIALVQAPETTSPFPYKTVLTVIKTSGALNFHGLVILFQWFSESACFLQQWPNMVLVTQNDNTNIYSHLCLCASGCHISSSGSTLRKLQEK